MSKVTEDLIIVGAGPAGLSAAIYAKQAGYNPLVIHSSDASLIATTDKVNNYLGMGNSDGLELWKSMKAHFEDVCGSDRSRRFSVDNLSHDSHRGVFTLSGEDGELEAKSVIWAAGAKPKKLGIEGEELETVSYCATCDGSFYEGDPHLAVVGGGDSAVEEALYLAELVDKVSLLVRSELRAKDELQQRLKANSKIEVIKGVQPQRFSETGGMLPDVHIEIDGSDDLTVSGVFVAIGHSPNSEPLRDYVELDESGFVKSSFFTPGLFVAGDIFGENHRQAIISAGDGARAGIDAANYLRENNS